MSKSLLNVPTLIGERVRLVPMESSHLDGLYHAAGSSEIWTYLPKALPTREDMMGLIDDALRAKAAGTELPFTIFDRQTGEIVGSTRFLDIALPHRNLEIGWTWLSPAVWRSRVNTECKYLLLRYCFEELNLVRVMLKTDARNQRSQRAIERLGAVKEGILRRHRILPDGFVRDTVVYSVISDEWPIIKQRLETFLSTDTDKLGDVVSK